MSLPWVYLLPAGLFEIGWPAGLKLSQEPARFALGLAMAVACMAISGGLLWLARRGIPMGKAYAVWVGIGAAGTFAPGVVAFGDAAGALRLAAVGPIVAGMIGLELAHG